MKRKREIKNKKKETKKKNQKAPTQHFRKHLLAQSALVLVSLAVVLSSDF